MIDTVDLTSFYTHKNDWKQDSLTSVFTLFYSSQNYLTAGVSV